MNYDDLLRELKMEAVLFPDISAEDLADIIHALENHFCNATKDAVPVRHGHWVHLGGDEWCCDKCGFVISTEGSWQHPKAKEAGHDYCMHCGAKMDERREDD